jgi:hypothetical protein
MSTPPKPPRDPFIEAEIERSIQPYVGLAPPALLEAMRDTLRDALTTHPVAKGLIGHLRNRPAPNVSGDGITDESTGSGREGA